MENVTNKKRKQSSTENASYGRKNCVTKQIKFFGASYLLTKSYPHCKMALTMTTDLAAVWKLTLAHIQTEISTGNFLMLFRQTALLELSDTTATIAAPSSIVINLLQRHTPVIKKALAQQNISVDKVVFIPKTIPVETPSKGRSASGGKKEELTPLFTQEEAKPLHIGHLPRVRPDYTFDTLAVSQSNQLAFVSAQTVASNPGTSYNPLFMYGPVGVGKTHLMQAIANAVYTKTPDAKILYITSEEFTNEVVEAIRSNDTARMKRKFRSVTLLIIDDVQFIAGKDKVQEELFHTFNSLIDGGGQIVLSSDRPPSEIKKLEARLSSRFAGGLTVDIEAPDFEMRTAIVLKKSEKFGFPISMDVAKIIAEQEQDVRSLEGALLRVITQASTTKQDVTVSLTQHSLSGRKAEHKTTLHADDIIDCVCEFYRIKPTQLKGPKRDASLVKARQITMYLLQKELGITLVEIGNILGGRDHTTVMHGVNKIEGLLVEKSFMGEEIQGITRNLRG